MSSSYFMLFLLALFVCGGSGDWVQTALQTQRNVSSSFTINKRKQFIIIFDAHMYSSEVYASVFRNQNLSLTAQFDLGVRYIELDLHYIPELNTSTGGPYRICHASSQVYTYCDNVTDTLQGWETCGQYGVVNYGPDTGCSPNSPNFPAIFSEISQWLTKNPSNVIVINLDDSISEIDVTLAGNMESVVNGWLGSYFNSSIYTPLDYKTAGGYWPTVQDMVNRGKQILFNTNGHTFGATYIYPDLRGFLWPASKIKFFSGYPYCTSSDSPLVSDVSYGFFQEDRLSLFFHDTLLYDGPEAVGIFDAASSLGVMKCEYTTFYDYISAESAQQLVWSWDVNQPAQTYSCASFDIQTGRWQSDDCNNEYFYSCRSTSNYVLWTLGDISSRAKYSKDVCPSGYYLSTPRTAKENDIMKEIFKKMTSGRVWMSLSRDPVSGQWADLPLTAPTVRPTTSAANSISHHLLLLLLASIVTCCTIL